MKEFDFSDIDDINHLFDKIVDDYKRTFEKLISDFLIFSDARMEDQE